MTDYQLGFITTFKGDYKADNDKAVLTSKDGNEILYISGLLSNLNAAIEALGCDKYISYKTTKNNDTYSITISREGIYQMYQIGSSFTIAPRLK